MDSIALIVLALIVIAAYLWYRIAYMRYTVFTKMGIPGPRPKAFYGNFIEFSQGGVEYMVELLNKYGKVCGIYKGGMPRYLIADPDMLKQIAIKNFGHFVDRAPSYVSNGIIQGMNGGKAGLLFGEGDKWQQTRRIVTPTFTSGKMKLMVHLLNDSCSALSERVQKVAETGKSEDMLRLYGEFTMETVLATAFGYKVELLRGKVAGGDELIQATQNVFEIPIGGGMMGVTLSSLHSHFLWLTPLMRWLGSRLPVHKEYVTLRQAALRFVQARRSNPIAVKKDFLQLVIDARVDDESTDDQDSHTQSSQTKKNLTDEEIVAVATDFIMAGYETTSNTLGFTSYLLALNTDKQDKLCAEIDAYYENNEDSSLYDAAMGIEYLDWVIQESLRIYPPGAYIIRYCQKTCTIDNVTFTKGSDIIFPTYAIHHSSEYWKEPDQFIPERFHPDEKAKRHPLVHMPFGLGPRNCIGMRFALMEAKMALLSILRRFKFERSPDTEVPLKTRLGITLGPVNGIHLNVVQH